MSRLLTLPLLAAAIVATPVLAQSPHRTAPIVVTAVRASETLAETLAAVDVVDREEIGCPALTLHAAAGLANKRPFSSAAPTRITPWC